MLKGFAELIDKAKAAGPFTVSVAAAQDRDVIEAMKLVDDMGLARGLFVGDERAIRPLLEEAGFSSDTPVVATADDVETAREAVARVRSGEAQVLMKGFINTSLFMKAVLNRDEGLRTGRLISHMACYEIPGQKKLTFCSDSGINVAPDLEQKKQILTNALNTLHAFGMETPKVAALAANEMVDPKIPATADARALVQMHERGELPECIIEGPLSLDIAYDREIARHKGIESRVAGDVDLFLSPTIEVGNVLGKAWLMYCKASWGGLVMGASHPIVLGSRSDTAEIKINSIALACLGFRDGH